MATGMDTAIERGPGLRCLHAVSVRRVAMAAIASLGGSIAYGGSWVVEPQVAVSTDYSSNMALATSSPLSGWTTDVAPGLRVNGAGARLKGFLDYKRDYLTYSANSGWNRQANQLSSFGNLEVVEKWFYVDASANIFQRNLFVFGPTSTNQLYAGAALGETKTYQVAPYIRGRLSSVAEYLVRADSIESKSNDPALVPTRVNQLVGSLKSLATSGIIGWFTDFGETRVRNDVLGTRGDDRVRGGLIVSLGARAHLSLSEGRETTDFASAEKVTASTPGVGFDWSPTQHTKIAALGERRFFGNGHNLVFMHTTPMTAWKYSDIKDFTVLPLALAGFNPGSIYELMSNLLEASIADPLERSRAVRARLDELAASAPVAGGGGLQTSRFYIDRVQEASAALLGKRNTVTLVFSQRTDQLPAFAPPAVDNFSQYDSDIRQRNATLTWLHYLTPRTTTNIAVIRTVTDGLNTGAARSKQSIAAGTVTVRVTQKTSAAIGVRETRGDNTLMGSFHEHALMGSLVQRF